MLREFDQGKSGKGGGNEEWVISSFAAYLFLVEHLDPVDAWLQADLV